MSAAATVAVVSCLFVSIVATFLFVSLQVRFNYDPQLLCSAIFTVTFALFPFAACIN